MILDPSDPLGPQSASLESECGEDFAWAQGGGDKSTPKTMEAVQRTLRDPEPDAIRYADTKYTRNSHAHWD